MTPTPAALLAGERGPWSPRAQEQVAALFSGAETKAAGAWLAEAHRALELDEAALGALAAVLVRTWDRQDADQMLWRQLASVQLALHCDFYEAVQVGPLATLCGSFIQQRLQHVPDPLYEAASLVQVWCVRLTGLPMTYDYLSAAELDRFAGITARYAADALPDPGERLRFLRGVARTLHAHVRKHAPSVAVPVSLPANTETRWETISWQEGLDALFLYPPD